MSDGLGPPGPWRRPPRVAAATSHGVRVAPGRRASRGRHSPLRGALPAAGAVGHAERPEAAHGARYVAGCLRRRGAAGVAVLGGLCAASGRRVSLPLRGVWREVAHGARYVAGCLRRRGAAGAVFRAVGDGLLPGLWRRPPLGRSVGRPSTGTSRRRAAVGGPGLVRHGHAPRGRRGGAWAGRSAGAGAHGSRPVAGQPGRAVGAVADGAGGRPRRPSRAEQAAGGEWAV